MKHSLLQLSDVCATLHLVRHLTDRERQWL
jgi:hypothetical protein